MVIAFGGTNAATGIALDGNLFFSAFFNANGATASNLEVLSWDATNGTYNYYKFDRRVKNDQLSARRVWKLRNISSELDRLPAGQARAGCLACHVNGAPVMKELSFPWNNWDSVRFNARYLKPGQSAPNVEWPIARGLLLENNLRGAEQLEVIVQSTMQRFADRLIEKQVTTNADGTVNVSGIRKLLDSLFMATELNLASSSTISGLDGGPLTQRATTRLPIPDSFFVNIEMMRDINVPVVAGSQGVPRIFAADNRAPTLTEYQTLVSDRGLETRCLHGPDTVFPWFGPEVAEFDRRMVARLLNKGIIDAGLIASALAVDLRNPMFSMQRASLFRHVPDQLTNLPVGSAATQLRASVVTSLRSVLAANRTRAERDFLAILESSDPVSELNQRVSTYRDEIRTALDPDSPATRAQMLEGLFDKLLSNRRRFRQEDVSHRLNEFDDLFPE